MWRLYSELSNTLIVFTSYTVMRLSEHPSFVRIRLSLASYMRRLVEIVRPVIVLGLIPKVPNLQLEVAGFETLKVIALKLKFTEFAEQSI